MKSLFKTIQIAIILVLLSGTLSAQKIYKTDDASAANVKVMVTDQEADADLKVYEVEKAEDVVKDGLWFEMPSAEEAMITVFMTDDTNLAQMKIFYVANPQDAGWITKDKRHYFKAKK